MSGRFIASAATVARPAGVSGTTRSPAQRKCSAQICVRGLNSGASSPDSGSVAVCLAHFRNEQKRQSLCH